MKRTTLILAGIYLLLTVAWLLAYLLPVAWEVAQATAFFLGLMVVVLLWWVARRQRDRRGLWWLLAASWTIGLTLSIAWGVYELVTGRPLPGGSWFGELYVVRYGLVMAAFGRCLSPWTRRRWAGLAGIGLLALAVTWCGLLWPTWAATKAPLSDLLSYALYPFLDVIVVGLAVWAWRAERAAPDHRNALGILLLSMIAYTAANWINLVARGASYEALAGLPAFFWALSDMLAGLAALTVLWVPRVAKTSEDSPPPQA